MSYSATKKQASAHKAFMLDGFKRGVLLMGRQCLAPDTLVLTNKGHVPIGKIKENDLVSSYNDEGIQEYKRVNSVAHYGVDVEPKPMLTYYYEDQKITSTYDHPFWHKGYFIPIYQLAWRNMDTGQRQKLELLCEQYGQNIDYEAIWRLYDGSDEAWLRQQRLSPYGGGRKDRKDAQANSRELGAKPQEPPRSKSQRLQPDEQQAGEPGVDDTQRQYPAHPQDGQSGEQTGRKLRNPYFERSTSIGYSIGQTEESGDSEGLRGLLVYRPGYPAPEDLVSYLTVSECAPTVSIEVEDNNNYYITPADILVANSGKTFFATQHSWVSATIEQGRYFVVFKTYKQAHEVVWRQYVPLIPKELIYKKNEQDLLIELNYIENTPITLPNGETILVNHDTSKPRSTIQLLGSDQSDSHRGFKANGIIFDEYADQDPNNWDSVYKHFFTTTGGWAIFMGTPRGYNHFYDMIQYAKDNTREIHEEDRKKGREVKEFDWFYQEATWRDSPYVKRENIEAERAEAEKKGTLATFLQEVELEFRSIQGAVFPSFSRKVHVVKPSDVPDDITLYVGIDFGYHTTACLFIGIDKDQNWWVFDEVYGKQEILKDLIPRIKQKIGDKRLTLMVGDSASKDAIETMARQFPIIPVVKRQDSIIHGLDLIRQKLKPRIQLVGDPKPTLFISSVCKNLIVEMESYKYPEDKKDRNPSEVPVKENDHGPDALRYVVLQLKYGSPKTTKPIIAAPQFNSYGL